VATATDGAEFPDNFGFDPELPILPMEPPQSKGELVEAQAEAIIVNPPTGATNLHAAREKSKGMEKEIAPCYSPV
jgi:hypothetical protein